jgi:hypothetical protein
MLHCAMTSDGATTLTATEAFILSDLSKRSSEDHLVVVD